MKQITPILFVETIEPSLPFWEDKLGFEREAEVPGEDGLIFVILRKNDVLVMYQTLSGLDDDIPQIKEDMTGSTYMLYVKVDNLDDVMESLDGEDIIVPRRTTFYGADETGYREPGGHIIVFAQMAPEESSEE